jgi:PAS domain S-box-containing protein
MNNEYPVNTTQLIVTKTDTKGYIIHANDVFCEISGYKKEELINVDHNIVRHPDMPSIVFKLLWVKLLDGQEVYAFVKNLRKDGRYYWVFANVKPTTDKYGSINGFISVRKAANRNAIAQIERAYKRLKSLESLGSYGQSGLKLKELLDAKSIKYNDFVRRLQKGERLI